jgi:iron(III) transport system ATP-binding protein
MSEGAAMDGRPSPEKTRGGKAVAPGELALERVSKVFQSPEGRDVRAVDDASIVVTGGEFVTLLGPSGCGKTTTLRMVAGFEQPTTGRILLDGQDVSRLSPDKREMGMVFQSYALFPHLSVFENVAYGLRLRGRRGRSLDEAVRRTLASVNLSGLEERRPSALSGGQQQRVALARAMAIEPRVLLFDEPLSNLDAKLRVSLRSEIRRIQQQLGTTALYVTHDQAEAMSLSDRIVVMNGGRVEQFDTPDTIYRRPRTRFVADFIGRANFVPGEVVAQADGERADVRILGRVARIATAPGVTAGSSTTVVLRPESIRLDEGDLAAVVRSATFLGPTVEYDIDVDGQLLSVVDHEWVEHEVHQPGERVAWSFRDEQAYALGPD